jgi:hypothetical protein
MNRLRGGKQEKARKPQKKVRNSFRGTPLFLQKGPDFERRNLQGADLQMLPFCGRGQKAGKTQRNASFPSEGHLFQMLTSLRSQIAILKPGSGEASQMPAVYALAEVGALMARTICNARCGPDQRLGHQITARKATSITAGKRERSYQPRAARKAARSRSRSSSP